MRKKVPLNAGFALHSLKPSTTSKITSTEFTKMLNDLAQIWLQSISS